MPPVEVVEGQVDTMHALATIDHLPDTVLMRRPPEVVLGEARQAAAALATVIAGKKKVVQFNGEQYIENEDWQVIGHFYGLSAEIESDSYVRFGDVEGFEATAVLLDRTGRKLSRATAMCLRDEENWGTRPAYAWCYKLKDGTTSKPGDPEPDRSQMIWKKVGGKDKPDKVKVQTGDEKVPLFQLRSMAQTRACSKVHSMVLRFVPVLAGYRPTPSEELPKSERTDRQDASFDDVDQRTGEVAGAAAEAQPRRRSAPANTAAAPAAPAGAMDADFTEEKPKAQAADPAPAQAAAAVEADAPDTFIITRIVELSKGTSSSGAWVLYGIETKELGKGVYLKTFKREIAAALNRAMKAGTPMRIDYHTEQNGERVDKKIDEVGPATSSREPGSEG